MQNAKIRPLPRQSRDIRRRRRRGNVGTWPSLGDDGCGWPAGSVEPPNAPKPQRRESSSLRPGQPRKDDAHKRGQALAGVACRRQSLANTITKFRRVMSVTQLNVLKNRRVKE